MTIPQDKLEHFIAGVSIFGSGALLFNVTAGIALACVAGIGKELVWDWWLGKGDPDPRDAISTILGGLSGLVVAML
jgi:hypothetical protein